MAEIRSTMDLVMERAARMGKATSEELRGQERHDLGMRLAAGFLNAVEDGNDLLDLLKQQEPTAQSAVRKGMVEALLRNVVLARNEIQLTAAKKALNGIVRLGGGAGDLKSITRDLEKIISQYGQHREQIRKQLEDQVRMQIEQVLARQPGRQTGRQSAGLKIDPTLQPQFQEEWNRIEADLGEQYSRALEQHRQLLRQRLAG